LRPGLSRHVGLIQAPWRLNDEQLLCMQQPGQQLPCMHLDALHAPARQDRSCCTHTLANPLLSCCACVAPVHPQAPTMTLCATTQAAPANGARPAPRPSWMVPTASKTALPARLATAAPTVPRLAAAVLRPMGLQGASWALSAHPALPPRSGTATTGMAVWTVLHPRLLRAWERPLGTIAWLSLSR
jgi:hypothetical protein